MKYLLLLAVFYLFINCKANEEKLSLEVFKKSERIILNNNDIIIVRNKFYGSDMNDFYIYFYDFKLNLKHVERCPGKLDMVEGKTITGYFNKLNFEKSVNKSLKNGYEIKFLKSISDLTITKITDTVKTYSINKNEVLFNCIKNKGINYKINDLTFLAENLGGDIKINKFKNDTLYREEFYVSPIIREKLLNDIWNNLNAK